ncbi:apolipoprotein N-acyltransferase [Caldovatus aquaticus]|uniref:apolipoprotein N-acyltransferase n=1 Tax=Caldovatus aquaticus TaxID=2865671 RepID=UPI0034E27DED
MLPARLLRRIAALPPRRALLLAFGLGLLAALALPPVHAVPALLVSVPGLLALVGTAPSARRAALLGLFWGWGHFAGGLYWITHAILTEVERFWWLVPIAVPALSFPLGLFVALPAALAWRAAPGWPRLLVFAGAFILAEMLRGVVLTGFPWNLIGTVWAFAAVPIQGAAWVGVHGLGLATLLLAGLPAAGAGWRPLAGGAAAAAALFGLLGAARLAFVTPPADQPWRVVLVQGNIAQDLKWRPETRLPIFRRYLDLTESAIARLLPDLAPGERIAVIWPETASPFRLAEDAEARRLIAARLPPDAVLLAGTLRVEWAPDGRPLRVFNSLLAVDAEGRVTGGYDKAHLVPFGEYMPLRGLLPVRLAPTAMDISPGPGLVAIAPSGLPPLGALICYEVIFPGAVTPAPRPAWLVNVTNDAWFGFSAGPYQHLAAARLRAVEEGLPVARAAQTGISALFDPYGRPRTWLGLGETGAITARLPAPRAETVFARLGLAVPAALALGTWLAGWWLGRVRGRRES